MSETPGQVLERLHFENRDRQIGNWSRLPRDMYDILAAAFLAEMLPDCWPGDDCETDECPWCGEYEITKRAARTIWLAKDAQEARR